MNRFKVSELVKKGIVAYEDLKERLKNIGIDISGENDELAEETLSSVGVDIKKLHLDKRQELLKQAIDRRKRHSKVTEVIVKDTKDTGADSAKRKLTKEELLKKKLELEKSLKKVDADREKAKEEQVKIDTEKVAEIPTQHEDIQKDQNISTPIKEEEVITEVPEVVVAKSFELTPTGQEVPIDATKQKKEEHGKGFHSKKQWGDKRQKDGSTGQGGQRDYKGRHHRDDVRKHDGQKGARPPHPGKLVQKDSGQSRDTKGQPRPHEDRQKFQKPQKPQHSEKGKKTEIKDKSTAFSPVTDVLIEDKELIVKKKKWEEDVPETPVEEKDIESKKVKVKKSISKKEKNLKQNILEDLELLELEKEVEVEKLAEEEFVEEVEEKVKKVAKTKEKEKEESKEPKVFVRPSKITIGEAISVNDLAGLLGVKIPEIIKKLMGMGMFVTANQSIDAETVQLIAMDYGVDVDVKTISEEDLLPKYESKPENLRPRPPIVTVMGHVDHGKTSLLDAIRKTKVAEKEAGGITQHIGAYEVDIDRGKIVFLDTPGHEAFTTLRARGANVTDIVILVVAADDGVMPQTKEAIDHARAAGVRIVVAINKIDKPNANPEKVKTQLAEYGIISEEWGGEYQFQEISAKNRIGIDDLLERVLLEAEMLELKGDYVKPAEGIIIESRLDKQKGVSVSLIVKDGVLRVGDTFIAGVHYGKVRAMFNYAGKNIKEAGPSIPVELMGFSEVPEPGETLLVVPNEKIAKQIVDIRLQKQREKDEAAKAKLTLDDIFNKIKEGEIKDLNIILKADVQGSLEALKSSLVKLSNSEVKVKIIHDGVGGINESDVLLAMASKAIIIGFNVRPDAKAKTVAEREKIDIRLYSVIYQAIEEVQKAIEGMLTPEIKENIIGKVEIRKVFSVPKVGKVAGCYVLEGRIVRNANVRVIRDNIVIYTGKINSLKRFQDDVREVVAGYECGLGIANYNDIKEGDILEVFEMVEEKKLLKDVE